MNAILHVCRLKESLVEALAARDMSLECEDSFIDIESPTDKAIQLLGKFLEGQEVRDGTHFLCEIIGAL